MLKAFYIAEQWGDEWRVYNMNGKNYKTVGIQMDKLQATNVAITLNKLALIAQR